MLKIGDKAPQFKVRDQNEKEIALKDFAGRKVVLYFYPKDMTSGCTKEACDFTDSIARFNKIDAVVLGVSADSILSHKKFSEKYNLKFSLLADEDKKVIHAYDVWKEKSMYGKKYMGIERTTFIIDEKGKIQKIYNKVKVPGHVEQIISDLKN